jgi:heptosyltransferase-2
MGAPTLEDAAMPGSKKGMSADRQRVTEMEKLGVKATPHQGKLTVRGGKRLPKEGVERVLIRGTNWIGDVIMTLPAVAAIRKTWPGAQLFVLAKPWVAEIYRLSSNVDEVILFEEPGCHAGIGGKWRLVAKLRQYRFDCAILLQNAIEAAIIARLTGIPLRAGYNADGRGFLLTHPVRRTPAIRLVHQIDYYLDMVRALGCLPAGRSVHLHPDSDYAGVSERFFNECGIQAGHPLIGLAPGAAYGPAKKWFPERFAAVVDRLIDDTGAQAILFGSSGDKESAAEVRKNAHHPLIDIAGRTNLREAIALISRCDLFISNDSGLMHVAGALGIPTVAIFGSTNPMTTSPVGEASVVIHRDVPCSPCLKPICPTDFSCMDLIGVDEVYSAARGLIK